METCALIKNKKELALKIDTEVEVHSPNIISIALPRIFDKLEKIKIYPFGFDKRNGWNTHIVVVDNYCLTQDPYIVGFLSDILNE
jgi:hypothetical protein